MTTDALAIPLHVHRIRCHHLQVYRLPCEEFDWLKWRAAGRCEICRIPAEDVYRGTLHIDHDSRLGNGWNHVRGLLCARDNSHLRYVDNGYRDPTPEQLRYLETSWFLTRLAPERREHPWLPASRGKSSDTYWHKSPRPAQMHPLPYRRAIA